MKCSNITDLNEFILHKQVTTTTNNNKRNENETKKNVSSFLKNHNNKECKFKTNKNKRKFTCIKWSNNLNNWTTMNQIWRNWVKEVIISNNNNWIEWLWTKLEEIENYKKFNDWAKILKKTKKKMVMWKPYTRFFQIFEGHWGNRTPDLSHPKRESYH